ncbi:hypothetical protein EGW08_007736 [Elysia chlorotica]|uniref:Uncharacterized protein n=1 Tax=Elysia chlorotica TaxID=188477 RepID=A0A3S1BIL5_ELYCH|nr:hypothetical protein EGW08_007736 [Elysia chlorotica]
MQLLLKTSSSAAQDCSSACGQDESYECWEKIVLVLISHLMQGCNRDFLLLVGTALSMVFNCAPSLQITESSYLDIISLLTQGKNSFEFCGICYCQEASSEKDMFLPVIAIIKGLLVSCDKNTLKSGKHPLIFQIFPQILNFCKGPSYPTLPFFSSFSPMVSKTGKCRCPEIFCRPCSTHSTRFGL